MLNAVLLKLHMKFAPGWALIWVNFDPIWAKSRGWALFHEWALFRETMVFENCTLFFSTWDAVSLKTKEKKEWNIERKREREEKGEEVGKKEERKEGKQKHLQCPESTYLPAQTTPASSLWPQLWTPQPLKLHEAKAGSLPLQWTSSIQMLPVPWPNLARVVALVAPV